GCGVNWSNRIRRSGASHWTTPLRILSRGQARDLVPRHSSLAADAAENAGIHSRRDRDDWADSGRDDRDLQRGVRRPAAAAALPERRARVLDLVRSTGPRSLAVQRA